jgi:amino acid adenylation domain-containing protein
MSEGQREQLLVEWNDTRAEYPREQCLHELFGEQAARTPEAVAVVWGEQRLSYQELDRRSRALAQQLRRLGVGPEVPVGVCLERSAGLVVGLLAILQAGGAYVPLDPAYPRERLAFMLEDSRAGVLLTQSSLREQLPVEVPHLQVVCLDASEPEAQCAVEQSPPVVRPNHLAYVIYTSGSTGKPKGVAIEHRSAVALVHWARGVYPAEELAGVLASTSICFDLSVFELFVPLSWGGTVILAENALALPTLAGREQVRLINTVPSAIAQLLRVNGIPRSVRTVNLAGEALSPRLVQQLYAVPTIQKVYDLYGPSEDTTYSTCALRSAAGPATIGRPIANTQVYILDGQLEPVPVGVAGELWLGGEGLARGYLHRPELTAGKFIRHPFSADPAARLYRTGDLARYRGDGNIEFLGRMDHQVKVRGYRIELGEIESVLGEHPAVQAAAAVVREEQPGDPRLVAYVVARQENPRDAELRIESEWLSDVASQFESGYSAAIEEAGEGSSPSHDPTLNIYAWSGLEKTEEEVTEWVEQIAARVLRLRPKKLLEIGCGTGLVLFRLTPHCEEFWGTDLSQAAVDNIGQRLKQLDSQPRVKLFCRMADDFRDLPAGVFDGVIINAVVEYFPTVDYLLRVTEGAIKLVRAGGFIFFGTVPNLALHDVFHTAWHLSQATEDDDTATVKQLARKRMAEDQRMLLSPEFFHVLKEQIPQISHVEIKTLRSRFHNEASRIIADTHYDAILHIAGEEPPAACQWLDWQKDRLTAEKVSRLLKDKPPAMLGVTNVPHGRLMERLKAMELLAGADAPAKIGELHRAIEHFAADDALEDLQRACEKLPFTADVSWSNSGADGLCDVVFYQRSADVRSPRITPERERARDSSRSLRSYAANPLQVRLARKLIPQWRACLEGKLPDYMIPSAFVLLERLPLTPNGKLDRRALPAPDFARTTASDEAFVAPRTPAETTLAQIWRDVLGLEQVGVNDNFFELGGHSLLVTQVVSRVREAFQVDLPMRRLFEAPTVAGLAAALEEIIVQEIDELSEDEAKRFADSAS